MAVMVLPDKPQGEAVVRVLVRLVGSVLKSHPSGRPWLIGTTDGRRRAVAHNRNLTVVLVGRQVPEDDELERALKDVESLGGLDSVAERYVEYDTLLFAREHDRLRCQAPLFLARSLFWTVLEDGLTIICDEQMPLAELNSLTLDLDVLASRLTNLELSYPFSVKPIWQGVNAIGPGEYLDVQGRSRPTHRNWWTPPTPDRRLAELAPEVSLGIAEAVQSRTGHEKIVSSDLSGGLDSTTLSFSIAENRSGDHLTFFMRSSNATNNDWKWADRAAREIGSNHLDIPYDSIASTITETESVSWTRLPEGPGISSLAEAATPAIARKIAEHKSTVHLNGHAGDALFGPVSSMLWSLVRSNEPARLYRVWRHRVLNRLPMRSATRMLARKSSYLQDLRGLATSSLEGVKADIDNYARWVSVPEVHEALTDSARERIQSLASRALDQEDGALSEDLTVHQIVQYLVVHGASVRRMNLSLDGASAPYFESPFLDRRVVDPALSLNIGERAFQYPAKPLLAAARPTSMSVDYFLRHDKGDYSAEIFDQHRAQMKRIHTLFCDGSELESLGMIDRPSLLQSIAAYSADGSTYTNIRYIELMEQWLRSLRNEESRRRTS